MLRFRILASVVPLAVAAVLARGHLFAEARPCVAVADMSVQLTSLPWQSDLHVGFTNDPSRATVRVEITDSAETADFAVIDDIDNADAGACPTGPAATGFDLGKPLRLRARDLPDAAGTCRLPHLRAIEDLLGCAMPPPSSSAPAAG